MDCARQLLDAFKDFGMCPRVNGPSYFSLFFPTISTTESNEFLFLGNVTRDKAQRLGV